MSMNISWDPCFSPKVLSCHLAMNSWGVILGWLGCVDIWLQWKPVVPVGMAHNALLELEW